MSKARHAKGGKVEKINDGREKEEAEEMEEGRAAGGKVVTRKRGGSVEQGEGMKGGRRLDRPGRKRGGGVGSNRTPLSTAANVEDADGHKGETGKAGSSPLE